MGESAAERVRQHALKDPIGNEIRIPIDSTHDQPYFGPNDAEDIRRYYEEQGYVVIRRLIPAERCDEAQAAFAEEVRDYPGFIYRQATANPERHLKSEYGYMLNSILNVHCMDPRRFPTFRRRGTELVTSHSLRRACEILLGEPGKLVQTMYFEGNPATWPHQDTYYLDAEKLGGLVGAWIAVEDVAPGAGRFFVYPGSHKIEIKGGGPSLGKEHDRYKQLMRDLLRDRALECRAPALQKGDVLFWSSKTIHGSLETTTPERSRRSFTAHYIPQSMRFLQFQTRVKPLALGMTNGMLVHHPKDLRRAKNRAVFFVETRFPRAFQAAKRLAVRTLTR